MSNGNMAGRPPRSVEAGQGWNWWGQAWRLFSPQALWWVVLGLAFMVIVAVLMVVPLIGQLAGSLLVPVLMGGFMLAARKVQDGGTLAVADLLSGCQRHLAPLLVLGALLALASLVITVVAGTLGVGAAFGVAAGGMHGNVGGVLAGMGVGLLALLLSLLCGMVLGMLIWFAPALVVFQGAPPLEAMKASFTASLKNVVPFLVYSVVNVLLAFVASIAFGLGWLVLMPLMLLTVYVSYTDIFGG